MLQQLTKLHLEDRYRKQVNATLHASTFRPQFLNYGDKQITEKFASRFQIEYAGIQKSSDTMPKPVHHQPLKRQPLDTTSNASFEFVSDGTQVIAKK
jgi:hypothetical protein